MPVAAGPCGALYMKRSVLSVRRAACSRVTYLLSTPTGYAVSANPIAATLEKLFVGQRSGVRPVLGSLLSQNHLKVYCCRVSRKAVCRRVRANAGRSLRTSGLDTAGPVAQPGAMIRKGKTQRAAR